MRCTQLKAKTGMRRTQSGGRYISVGRACYKPASPLGELRESTAGMLPFTEGIQAFGNAPVASTREIWIAHKIGLSGAPYLNCSACANTLWQLYRQIFSV
eukprot:1155493-Pelagomonas_calceolata.AAC.6